MNRFILLTSLPCIVFFGGKVSLCSKVEGVILHDGAPVDRAAVLKMLTHLYLVNRQGSQSLWVYAPPKAYAKWVLKNLRAVQSQ